MKIRTDFVTNSSSYSSAEIIIDNPVLLEILERYKDKGVFGGIGSAYNIGSTDVEYAGLIGNMEGPQITKTPAFYCIDSDTNINYTPLSIGEVLDNILRAIDDIIYKTDKEFNEVSYGQLKDELINRKDEISSAYNFVKWETSDSTNEHDGDFPGDIWERHVYSYDKGGEERYHNIVMGNNYETNERITFVENLIVDGKVEINFVQEIPGGSEEDLL